MRPCRSGEQRSDIEFQSGHYVAVSNDRAEALNDARSTVAFYGGAVQYEELWGLKIHPASSGSLQLVLVE